MLYETCSESPLSKEERKAETSRLRDELTALQHQLSEKKLPVIVLVEGWGSAGKGYIINELVSRLDPRYTSVFSLDSSELHDEPDRYPFLYPFFNAIPESGKILFMDSGWMERAVRARMKKSGCDRDFQQCIRDVRLMERQLTNDGYVVVKLFLDISREEQAKRQELLLSDKSTAWRVSKRDLKQNRKYDAWRSAYDCFMEATNDIIPWHVIRSESRGGIRYETFRILMDAISDALANGRKNGEPYEEYFPMSEPLPSLKNADLTQALSDEAYEAELEAVQARLARLHNELYRRRIPVIVCYEGWDAAGKGGNIRRLTYPLDPRGFTTWPIAAPLPFEKARHHLWRFWQKLPRTGHIAIFDRTWYGRVMVERLEGFCTENDWKRAYAEMNEFEQLLTQGGAVVLKFWIQIDPETQLERFTDRQNTPEKQWKITEEDWRNREKWQEYESAVQEMLEKTSTAFAPWHIVESNDKKFARIKALRIAADAMERAIQEKDR